MSGVPILRKRRRRRLQCGQQRGKFGCSLSKVC
jgi:hypothetical protein